MLASRVHPLSCGSYVDRAALVCRRRGPIYGLWAPFVLQVQRELRISNLRLAVVNTHLHNRLHLRIPLPAGHILRLDRRLLIHNHITLRHLRLPFLRHIRLLRIRLLALRRLLLPPRLRALLQPLWRGVGRQPEQRRLPPRSLLPYLFLLLLRGAFAFAGRGPCRAARQSVPVFVRVGEGGEGFGTDVWVCRSLQRPPWRRSSHSSAGTCSRLRSARTGCGCCLRPLSARRGSHL